MNDYISKLELVGVNQQGEKFNIIAKVGKPYFDENSQMKEWRCSASISPLHENLDDAGGIDSFLALSRAMGLVVYLLKVFVDNGGKLYLQSGEEFPFYAYGNG
jgi:hypothetical protein